MSRLLRTIHFFLLCTAIQASPARYDQRQTGDLNVQVHLKDLQVVALVDGDLLDDYTDYDYAYDYSQFTIKPTLKPTTSSAAENSSVKPDATPWPTHPPTSAQLNSTKELDTSTTPTVVLSTLAPTSPTKIEEPLGVNNHTELMSKKIQVRCGGTVDDPKKCKTVFRRRFSFLPLRILPKMLRNKNSRVSPVKILQGPVV